MVPVVEQDAGLAGFPVGLTNRGGRVYRGGDPAGAWVRGAAAAAPVREGRAGAVRATASAPIGKHGL